MSANVFKSSFNQFLCFFYIWASARALNRYSITLSSWVCKNRVGKEEERETILILAFLAFRRWVACLLPVFFGFGWGYHAVPCALDGKKGVYWGVSFLVFFSGLGSSLGSFISRMPSAMFADAFSVSMLCPNPMRLRNVENARSLCR